MRKDKAVARTLKRAGRPLTAGEIVASMDGEGVTEEYAEHVLGQMAKNGAALRVGRKYVALRERNVVVGRLSLTRQGYGFVSHPAGDVFVPRKALSTAMHGDVVVVRLSARARGKGRAGEVVQVVERANSTLVGRFERQGAIGIVVPTDPRLRTEVFVQRSAFAEAVSGDLVVARLTRFPADGQPAQGVIEEVLGKEGDPGVDIEVVIREHALRPRFPAEVVAEAEAMEDAVRAELGRGRQDLRDTFTVTIDGVDAKDFDDAISLDRSGGGSVLGVHIADVGHYVGWDSGVDLEARLRATSVYLVDRVLPMLPEKLSNHLCSLRPAEDKLAVSVMMELDRKGALERYRIFPSVIRSDRRLTYEDVDSWLAEDAGWPDRETERLVRGFERLAGLLHERRIGRGGLDFETVEPKVWLDERGKPTGVTLRQRTTATNMIEEAMILANEVVAAHMTRAEAPMVYRIHEDPDPAALDEIAVILKEFDYPIKDVQGATPRTFQKIVQYAHARPEKLLINSLLLRALKRARYVPYLSTHFGLASEAYTHFTSPIRRYPDLLVHRLLKHHLTHIRHTEEEHDVAGELEWLTEHCSVMEREAESAEDDSVRIKLCELMAAHIGEEFDGIITAVAAFGFFVQLANTAEGLVHVDRMKDDCYSYDAERHLMVGDRRGRVFRLGAPVRVRIAEVAVSQKRIDLELA